MCIIILSEQLRFGFKHCVNVLKLSFGEQNKLRKYRELTAMNLVKKTNETFRIDEIVYILYFSVMTLAKGLGLYDGMWTYTLALCVGTALIFVKLILTEHTISEIMYILSMLMLGILAWYNSGEKGAFIYLAMIIGMKNVSLKRLFTVGVTIWSSTFVLLIITTLTGVKTDIFMIHQKLGLGYIIRWALGQPHPNVLQITFMIICAMILYLTNLKGKKLVITTLVMFLGNLYIFLYSISYTGFILVSFYLAINLYLSFRKELKLLEKIMLYFVFPFCLAFAVLLPIIPKGNFWEFCEKLLNTRLMIARFYLLYEPLSLFGSMPTDPVNIPLTNIDNSYVFIIEKYGIILFALMCIAYMAYIHRCIKDQKHLELSIVLSLVLAATTEPFFVNPSFKNISLLFVGEYIYTIFYKFAQEKPDLFWNKKICLCSLGSKEICLPVNMVTNSIKFYYNSIKKNCKRILLTGICVALLAGTIFAVSADIPKHYYALRTSAQMVEKEYILLDIENLPEDFEGEILNYRDAQTPMLMFEGNISTMEYVRGIVSSGLWCGFFAALLSSFLFIKKWRMFK